MGDLPAAQPIIARLCDACAHYCGWCSPVTCGHGPQRDSDAHLRHVGTEEPDCYQRHAEQAAEAARREWDARLSGEGDR